MLFSLATIAFGALGPVKYKMYRDEAVQVQIAYRIAHDRECDTDEDAITPSIATGTLTLTAGGRRSVIDLATLFPIREDHIVLAEAPPSNGCGLVETFARRGRYLAVEAIAAQKGCAPVVSFVDIETRKVIQSVVIDHATDYRYDVERSRFVGVPLSVRNVERITLKAANYNNANQEKTVPWPYYIVHAIEVGRAEYDFAFDQRYNASALSAWAMAGLPTVGSRVVIGTVVGPRVWGWSVPVVSTQRFVRLNDADEKRYAARLPVESPRTVRLRQREAWFEESSYEAAHGNFNKAIADWATMLTFETDRRLYSGESTILASCRRLQTRVNSGALSKRAASASFAGGCKVPRGR